jgi:transcription-repair coupling factor (superfamily II helicase)
MHPIAAAAARLRADETQGGLLDRARDGRTGAELRGAAGFTLALRLALLAERLRRPLVLATPDIRRARTLARDLGALSRTALPGEVQALVLPALLGEPYALVKPHDVACRERVATLEALREPLPEGGARALVVPAEALLNPLPPPETAARAALVLEVGAEVPPKDVVARLVEAGYETTDIVSTWGDVSHRGAVLDVFPPDAEAPVRAEYWGDEITELRTFDPATQRSTGHVARVRVGALREAPADREAARRFGARVRDRIRYGMAPRVVETVLDELDAHGSFPGFEVLRFAVERGTSPLVHVPGALVACDRPDLVEAELRRAREAFTAEWTEELQPFLPGPDEVLRPIDDVLHEVVAGAHVLVPDVAWDRPGSARDVLQGGAQAAPHHGGDLGRCLRDLRTHLEGGGSAGLVLASPGRLERVREVLHESGLGGRIAWTEGADARPADLDALPPGSLTLGRGLIEAGARLGDLLVLSEGDVFGDVPPPRKEGAPRKKASAAFTSDLRDLKKGDFIVHADHGIGRFDGLATMGDGEAQRDFVVIVYEGGDKLYVPLDRLDLVEKYSGVGGLSVRVDRLGGATWEKVRSSVKRAMVDMTRELLDLYAARKTVKGFRFSQDGEWQREFEDAFAHEETEDQATSIADVKADMTSERPMDRLVVGDVGYGKTEVAMRAAFKAVMDGKQAAVLAPTTVLALQHDATFTRRMAAWPVKIELLSRFRTDAQVRETLKRLKEGECDIAIGTHRLLSKDVVFKDLGLLVVDEEQRFGVRHKERLKALRKEVDVLTLTATPIPRTLSMALSGLRDMSVIETPPVGRHAVMTYVLPFSVEVAAAACRQELERGGQVYFVHDRVQSIYSMSNLVRRLVPGARIGVAHGQLPERELESVMVSFLQGDVDVLVATTVIENGLDVARANTLIVNRADRHGLSQLYQLRGRVGRSERQAHAYFFVPAKRLLSHEARRRLAALQEFTELGSGFRIAALDLEIRGAGNLLGGEQHGHIAALGFDMYVKLLEDTVRELTGQEAVADFRATVNVPMDLRLPPSYVPDENQRLMIYKRFATARDADRVAQLAQEVRDRYGEKSPDALERLAEHARLRVRAESVRIHSIEADGRLVKVKLTPDTKVHPNALMRVLKERPGATFSPDGLLTVRFKDPLPPAEAAWDLLRDLA